MRTFVAIALAAAGSDAARIVTHLNNTQYPGSVDCLCIGIDNIEGKTMARLKGGDKVEYPADLGARCEAWDAKRHPKCPGEKWCEQKWCYVNPCKCKNLAILPKPSVYIKYAMFQGMPVYYSYATCGSVDEYSRSEERRTEAQIEQTCKASVSSALWGSEKCRCVGIGPQPGTTKVQIGGKKVDFPADTGASCEAWEEGRHPECKGDSPPDWCKQKWCYVDPCSCSGLDAPAKTSAYVPNATYQGKPVYYSYETCGGKDEWTASRTEACVNMKSEEACTKLAKCAWTGERCLGKELGGDC